MSSKVLKSMTDIIAKSFPHYQAKREAIWISQELPQSQWLRASEKRAELVPLQYILGSQPFGKLDLKCKQGVLIPRLDTEEWVTQASKILENVQINNIVDYCTGSGCIGLGLASELPNVNMVHCIDFKDEAVTLTRENLQRNEEMIISRIAIHKGNLFDGYLPDILSLEESTNLLVSNPPYIPANDLNTKDVEPSVLKYEPKEALLGDLEFYEALCFNILSKNHSFKGFIFELGYKSQAEIVRRNLDGGIWTVGIRNDQAGHLRNVIGWKNDSPLNVLQNLLHDYL